MPDGTHNPYPGPRPFKPEEYRIFAGRDDEISELSSLIISHQAVLLYAPSGAGKTSLLNAGLTPALKEKSIELLPVARVGIPVPQAVQLNHVRNVYTYSAIGNLLPVIPGEETWVQTATLADALAQIPRAKDETGEPVLRAMAFDQFEELFSCYPQRWQDRAEFFNQVAEALRKDSFLRVLFVLREDYLAAFGGFAGLLPESVRTRYHLEPLREPEALLAITRPLEGTLWSYAEGVAEVLVKDLMTVTVENPSGEVVSVLGEFVEPVQLQVVCYSLFERLPPTHTQITRNDLRAFGNPDEALQLFYEKAIETAVAIAGIDEGELRLWFETHLITPSGTRGLVFRGRDMTGGIPNKVVDVLEAQHLIRPEVRSGSRWYELTHDRFIRPIQKSNVEWNPNRWSTLFEARFIAGIRQLTVDIGLPETAQRRFEDRWVRASMFLTMGSVYYHMKKYEDAIRYFTRANQLETPGTFAYPWHGLGNVYAVTGRTKEALAAYEQAIALDSKFASPWNNLGYLYQRMDRPDDAINAYQQASALDPKSAYPWNNLGSLYRQLDRLDDAINAYQRAIALDPKYANPWLGLGTVYQRMDRLDDAINAYQRAIALDPTSGAGRVSLAGCYRKRGQEAEYMEQLSKAREFIAQESEYDQACFEAISGNVDQALVLLNVAFEKNQVSPAWAQHDPDLEFIRDDPRFNALMAEAARSRSSVAMA